MLMIMGPGAGRAVVPSAVGQRGAVEGVDIGARAGGEGDMGSAFGLRARGNPEERPVILAEASVNAAAACSTVTSRITPLPSGLSAAR
jgi:hypothetical protein